MPAQSIGTVLVRLFCIYLAITAIQSLSYVVPAFVRYGYQGGAVQELLTSASFWLMITSILLPAVVAIWLWRNAQVVVPDDAADDRSAASADDAMVIGVGLLGLYLLISGLLNLVRFESAYSVVSAADANADEKVSQRLTHLAEIVFAVVLLVGKKRLSALLLKAKYAGTGADR